MAKKAKAKKKARGVGRPKKTLDGLPKNWKEEVLKLAKNGGSDVEIRVALGCISQDLWERFIAEEEEFSLTIKKAHLLCQCWWESQGRKGIRSKVFQTGLWTMNMKNRFGWTDKTDVQHDVTDALAGLMREISGSNKGLPIKE